ncbi:hypothetical protein Cni_G01815 [Canna indica]|uniref:Uncharacterized protein n=1 Tax=Canna indica TaxID=4628 RepID=A0AAQ3JPX6_9LILI|nr:hypothetical protein Cni_G01815 [Canna indica]
MEGHINISSTVYYTENISSVGDDKGKEEFEGKEEEISGVSLIEEDEESTRCGYSAVNASYYDLSYHPVSTNKECKLYKNAAGVAQYMKEWRVVAIFNVVLFVAMVPQTEA